MNTTTKKPAKWAIVKLHNCSLEVEYNLIKADPSVGLEAGVEIETVYKDGEDMSDLIEALPNGWGEIEKAVLEKR